MVGLALMTPKTYDQGAKVGMLGRQNEWNSSYVRLAHTFIFSLCFMSVSQMKSNCYSLHMTIIHRSDRQTEKINRVEKEQVSLRSKLVKSFNLGQNQCHSTKVKKSRTKLSLGLNNKLKEFFQLIKYSKLANCVYFFCEYWN